MELLARLRGELESGTTIHQQNILVQHPEWLAVRQALITALRPYPKASQAVGVALRALQTADSPNGRLGEGSKDPS